MENASKALIIAGSILLAIMIIAMGVMIVNKGRDSADTTSLDSTEITMFNQKFERYSGTQSGSQVKSLISFAISNASTNKDEPSKLPGITIIKSSGGSKGPSPNGGSIASNDINSYVTQLGILRGSITSTHPYTVSLVYNGSTGLIDKITIKE